jgi:hypothetical protein
MIEGDVIWDVGDEVNALVWVLVSQEFVDGQKWMKREGAKGYIKDPKSWWSLGFSARKSVELVFRRLDFCRVTGWVGRWTRAKTGWAGFLKTEPKLVAGWVERWTRAKTGWAGPETGWVGFQKTEPKIGARWVGNSTSFTKSIHDQNSRFS